MKRAVPWLLIALFMAAGGSWWVRNDMVHYLHAPLQVSGSQRFLVEPGASLSSVTARLEASGWLSKPWYFKLEARLQGKAGSLQAGEYAVTPGMTPLDLLNMLVTGRVMEHSLTLVEGWTFQRVMEAVNDCPDLRHTLAETKPAYVMQAIGHAGTFAEGRFFPDTYRFPAGTTDVQFLQRAFKAMNRVLSAEWQHRDVGLPYSSSYQALILASMVEKETAVPAERPEIAGVFVRRLERGMKLQSDPTVIYAMGAKYDGDIHKRDLKLDSPYNTYVYAGLPPTPIGLPGMASIKAALHPANSTALYFVSKGDGTHKFSSTLSEHNAAVRKYQLNGKARGAAGSAPRGRGRNRSG